MQVESSVSVRKRFENIQYISILHQAELLLSWFTTFYDKTYRFSSS